jgi:RNA polymerase sigma-70 factor (ECF subfamily)
MAFDFDAVYARWFDDVQRWLGAMGANEADVDDLTQELFVIVERKSSGFDGMNLPGWLYGIARRLVTAHRRKAWVRSMFLRRVESQQMDDVVTPAALLEQKEAKAIVRRALARLTDKRRRVFALFEIEGYTGEEIAALEGVPLKTVWTRLFYARRDFVRQVASVEARP